MGLGLRRVAWPRKVHHPVVAQRHRRDHRPETRVIRVHRNPLAGFVLVDDDLLRGTVEQSRLVEPLAKVCNQSGKGPRCMSEVIARAL